MPMAFAPIAKDATKRPSPQGWRGSGTGSRGERLGHGGSVEDYHKGTKGTEQTQRKTEEELSTKSTKEDTKKNKKGKASSGRPSP
jgi:hypothetical protein